MNEMVERVAAAIAMAASASGSIGDDIWRDMAEQAIVVMREPTEAMVDADGFGREHHAVWPDKPEVKLKIWQAMIDAALKE